MDLLINWCFPIACAATGNPTLVDLWGLLSNQELCTYPLPPRMALVILPIPRGIGRFEVIVERQIPDPHLAILLPHGKPFTPLRGIRREMQPGKHWIGAHLSHQRSIPNNLACGDHRVANTPCDDRIHSESEYRFIVFLCRPFLESHLHSARGSG